MILAFVFATAVAIVPVPEGKCVLVNGLLGEKEWDASAKVQLDADTELRVHKNAENLFLAVVFDGPRHTGIDLYLESGGRIRMLHVSSAIGEKLLEDGKWSELSWGRNSWWSANVVGTIVEGDRQRFLEPEAFEFQLDRRELGPDVLLFMRLKRPEKLLPAGASEAAGEGWLRLRLE